MKKTLLFIAALSLFSCKSTKNADCDAYGSVGTEHTQQNCIFFTDCVICIDTIHTERIHVHFYDHNTCDWSCLDMPEEDVIAVDTFYFQNNDFHVED